jgi:GT2 family glycosyltransferase
MISINLLSWNRPNLLSLTLKSLTKSLRKCESDFEIIVLDQGSNKKTLDVLNKYKYMFKNMIMLNNNIGMAAAWRSLFMASKGDYILPLENDWFCDAPNHYWLDNALDLMKYDSEVVFVKLRCVSDYDDFGWAHINHSPWTIQGLKNTDSYFQTINRSTYSYYKAKPQYISFTFNPILARRSFISQIHRFYIDDPRNRTVLRSGEDLPSTMWRKQQNCYGASLRDGPFRHTGLYNRYAKLTALPFYFLKTKLLPVACG